MRVECLREQCLHGTMFADCSCLNRFQWAKGSVHEFWWLDGDSVASQPVHMRGQALAALKGIGKRLGHLYDFNGLTFSDDDKYLACTCNGSKSRPPIRCQRVEHRVFVVGAASSHLIMNKTLHVAFCCCCEKCSHQGKQATHKKRGRALARHANKSTAATASQRWREWRTWRHSRSRGCQEWTRSRRGHPGWHGHHEHEHDENRTRSHARTTMHAVGKVFLFWFHGCHVSCICGHAFRACV